MPLYPPTADLKVIRMRISPWKWTSTVNVDSARFWRKSRDRMLCISMLIVNYLRFKLLFYRRLFFFFQCDTVSINMGSRRRILVINPNSTKSMTDNLRPLVDELGFPDVRMHRKNNAIAD